MAVQRPVWHHAAILVGPRLVHAVVVLLRQDGKAAAQPRGGRGPGRQPRVQRGAVPPLRQGLHGPQRVPGRRQRHGRQRQPGQVQLPGQGPQALHAARPPQRRRCPVLRLLGPSVLRVLGPSRGVRGRGAGRGGLCEGVGIRWGEVGVGWPGALQAPQAPARSWCSSQTG